MSGRVRKDNLEKEKAKDAITVSGSMQPDDESLEFERVSKDNLKKEKAKDLITSPGSMQPDDESPVFERVSEDNLKKEKTKDSITSRLVMHPDDESLELERVSKAIVEKEKAKGSITSPGSMQPDDESLEFERVSEDNLKKEKGKDAITAPGSMKPDDESLEFGQQARKLLPGIFDNITLNLIIPKLPWSTCHALSTVSHVWRQASRSREVYDTRVRSHSTETVLLINNLTSIDGYGVIGLYSARCRCFHQLPPIPHQAGKIQYMGIPRASQFAALNGKLYVLGGVKDLDYPTGMVHVIDLAGDRQWKQCASMKCKRYNFECGVLDGKIYAVGGFSSFQNPIHVIEVYHPELDIWSRDDKVANDREFDICARDGKVGYDREFDICARDGKVSYNCKLDIWPRDDEVFKYNERKEARFKAQGKIYSMSAHHIYVLDLDKDSRRQVHSFRKFHSRQLGIGPEHTKFVVISWTTKVVENELVTIVRWYVNNLATKATSYGESLLQSVGFGGKEKRIAWQLGWQKRQGSFSAFKSTMFPMEL